MLQNENFELNGPTIFSTEKIYSKISSLKSKMTIKNVKTAEMSVESTTFQNFNFVKN
jgi:hypothetical protein